MDGRGARFLLRCGRSMAAVHRPLAIVTHGNWRVERPLEILRWKDLLPLHASRDAAIHALLALSAPSHS